MSEILDFSLIRKLNCPEIKWLYAEIIYDLLNVSFKENFFWISYKGFKSLFFNLNK